MRGVLGFALLLACTFAQAERLAGVVIVVIDGDTVLFKPDHFSPHSRAFLKLRLAGIDAPELAQPHGETAARALRDMALRHRANATVVGVDTWGRSLAQLDVAGIDVNAELVRRGHAWSSSRGAENSLRRLQDEARAARRGLWADDAPVSPWAWRRTHALPN